MLEERTYLITNKKIQSFFLKTPQIHYSMPPLFMVQFLVLAFMLDFALKVCNRSDEVDDADFSALHAHGFDDEDIWDIGAITALFALSNRKANLTSMLPNDELYNLARDGTPRD